MRLYLSASGLTANTVLPPVPAGKRWRVVFAGLTLVSSATAGSRDVGMAVFANGSGGNQYLLCETTQGSTSASTTTTAEGSPTGSGGTSGTPFYSEVIIEEGDIVNVQGTLIAGDTFSYFLEIDEEESD